MTETSVTPATPEGADAPRWRRLAYVLREEAAHVAPAVVAAQTAVRLLPVGTGVRTRARILRAAGFEIGEGTVILGPVAFTGSRDPRGTVRIGQNVTINYGCVFDAAAPIVVEDDVGMGQDVLILTNRHQIGPPHRRLGTLEAVPVHVGRGAWLSTRCVLLPGVTVGPGAVVAAGAVVTRSVPAHTLVAGLPARPVRELPT